VRGRENREQQGRERHRGVRNEKDSAPWELIGDDPGQRREHENRDRASCPQDSKIERGPML
jgi:hypothetical protein